MAPASILPKVTSLSITIKQASAHTARGCHLEILQWSRQQVIALSRKMCTEAAAGGHLVVLQWLREQGCWDEDTCAAAARNGQLAALDGPGTKAVHGTQACAS